MKNRIVYAGPSSASGGFGGHHPKGGPSGGSKNAFSLAVVWLRRLGLFAGLFNSSQAQDSLDRFCVAVGDSRRRGEVTVAELADSEPLSELPVLPYPAEGVLTRKVAANGLVSVWGNRYSTPPGLIDTEVTVCWRLGDPTISIFSAGGRVVATHRKMPRGQRRVVRLPEHTEALENVVLAVFSNRRPCKPKPNQPPSATALAIAAGIGATPEHRDGDRPWGVSAAHRPATLEPEPAMSKDSVYQQLRSHLAYLGLATVAEALPVHLDQARQQDTGHTEFLEQLLRVEVETTELRRWETRLKLANFPTRWKVEDFDY